MSTGFLSRIFTGCQHQFAWPRRDETGGYYQLCVSCGCKYAYDWTKMRRTRKVTGDDANAASAHGTERKPSWTPRERRLHHQVPVAIRLRGSEEWLEGVSENISRSGLLLTCAMRLEEGQALEVRLEMPKELTGESPAQVICPGVVARVTELPASAQTAAKFQTACSIVGYEFTSRPPSRSSVQKMKIVAIKKRQNVG